MQFFKTLLSHFFFSGLVLAGMLLLFANLRFDYAACIFGAAMLAFLVFVYWPRKRG